METELRVRRQIKSTVLKNSLKSFVLPHVIENYEVAAIRTLVKTGDAVWMKRRILEEILCKNDKIVGFFSCLTAMEVKYKKRSQKKVENAEGNDDDDNDDKFAECEEVDVR